MDIQKLHAHFRPRGENPIQEGFDPAKYHALGCEFKRGDARKVMSRGELVQFSKCPSRWKLGYQEEETKATEWGSLLDCLVTQPGQFEKLYAVAPEKYPAKQTKAEIAAGEPVEMKPWNWNATFCDDWYREQLSAGKTCVKSDTAKEAFAAQDRLMEDRRLSDFLFRSRKQVLVQVEYEDHDSGIIVPMKCLIDLAPMPDDEIYGRAIGDFKTAKDASPSAWEKEVFNRNYHVQGSMYLDAMNAAGGTDYTQFAHLISENVAPYETGRRFLSDEYLKLGRAFYKRALADYCYCLKTGIYPGYDDGFDVRGENRDGWTITSPSAWMVTNPDDI